MITETANKLLYQMKQCQTQEEMENIWFDFKQTADSYLFNNVENYLINYQSYYFYITFDGIVGCIKERILGEL